MVRLGPFPLCATCQQINGGLTHTLHRQVHVVSNGRESCVDEGIAEVIADLWLVAATTGSCENDKGFAYVSAAPSERLNISAFMEANSYPFRWQAGRCYFALREVNQ